MELYFGKLMSKVCLLENNEIINTSRIQKFSTSVTMNKPLVHNGLM